eukprot:6212898-Pleurochrysis_carterae.AAC.13
MKSCRCFGRSALLWTCCLVDEGSDSFGDEVMNEGEGGRKSAMLPVAAAAGLRRKRSSANKEAGLC